jgi:hypothetical protein
MGTAGMVSAYEVQRVLGNGELAMDFRSSDELEEARMESAAVHEAAVKIAKILEEVETEYDSLAAERVLDIVTGKGGAA